MEISSNKLVEIPKEEWQHLRDLYKVDWPSNLVGFYTLDNFVRWTEKDPNIKNLKAYSLDGDYSDGTFLFVVSFWFYFLYRLKCFRLEGFWFSFDRFYFPD